MKVVLTPDQEDKVVRKTLKKTIDSLYKEKALVLKRQKGHMMSIDIDEDILYIENLIDAMRLAHNFFSTEGQCIKDNCTGMK